jgi:mannose-6-phosphate isomerase-like protein (cupin superfamily)
VNQPLRAREGGKRATKRRRLHGAAGTLAIPGLRNHAMKSKQLRFGRGFRVAFDVRKAQAAEMVLEPGGREGGPDNRHRGADQWLFVISGSGVATVEGVRVPLKAGRLLAIERGERHEIRNTGRTPLKTLNFYYPPAFDADGDPVGPGKKR